MNNTNEQNPQPSPEAAQPEDRHELQRDGMHPAPCARHCEAPAFKAEIRRLQAAQSEASSDKAVVTDAKIYDLAHDHTVYSLTGWHFQDGTRLLEFARALLQSAAPSAAQAEPVALVYKDGSSFDFIGKNIEELPDGISKLYAHPPSGNDAERYSAVKNMTPSSALLWFELGCPDSYIDTAMSAEGSRG